jgi:CubicO group peptidase (beta-lactamase class C family)
MPSRSMTWAGVVVLSAALLATPADADDKSPIEGKWDFRITCTGGEPEYVAGRFVLVNATGKWSGDLAIDGLPRKQKLTDVVVQDETLKFRVDATEFELRMEGKLAKGAMSGTATWTDGDVCSWTAARPDGTPIERFEKGLTFDGYFPKGDAETLGMDGAELNALVREASKNDTDALVVLRDGKVVVERTFGRPPGPIHVMSVTKFVAAFAVAMLLEDKKIASIDEPLSKWFPEWTNGRRVKVTLRHVLTHTSGIQHEETAERLNEAEDKVAYVRARSVTSEPGAQYSYNNDAVALLSGVLGAAAGRPVDDYLKERLFAPLGVKEAPWDRDTAGNTITYAQLSLSARDLARVGQLVVDGGTYGAKKLLAQDSIAHLSTPATPVQSAEGNLESDQGLLWMLLRDDTGNDVVGVCHGGWLGQWIVVYPKTRTVAVRLRRWKNAQDADKRQYQFYGFARQLADAMNEP